ncbi:hypothetical protein ACROYT_G024880 [Oculina patagonica]
MMRIVAASTSSVVSVITASIFLVINIYLRIYFLWIRISTWFLNCILSFILVWWFGLNDVTITIGEFRFLSVRGVKVRWKDDPGLTIEEVSYKSIKWNFEKLRDITILFQIKDLHRELFTEIEDSTTDIYTSFILHWKMHSPSDLLSSDLRNSSETIPTSFTLLHATDVEIGSRLRVHRGGSYVALFEAAIIDGLLVPSEEATSLYIKGREMTYCCGPYDPGLIQARREKVLKMSLMDFLGTWYSKGPSQITISYHGVQVFLSPSKVNSCVIYQNHLLAQLWKGSQPGSSVTEEVKSNPDKSLEVNVKSDNSKASICFQDGGEAISLIMSFNLSLHRRNRKTQYTASVGIQAFVPSRQQTRDPCVIVGNELISVPWECTFTGSRSAGHSTVARVTSEQNFSLLLRPECVPVFWDLHEEYTSLLDLRHVSSLLGLLRKKVEEQSSPKQIFINCKGVRLSVEMDVYEELLNVSFEDIKAEFNRDQHHTTLELSIKDLEVEDCTDKIIALQQQRSNGISSLSLMRFSLMQDAAKEEERTIVRRLHIELGNSTIFIQEQLILKLLQFAGIKEKTQLWGEETNADQENANENLPAFLTTRRFYFEKLHVEPFQVVVTCNPANALPDELQSLKTALEIPAGFPPLMENANVQFGEFLRTGISYKTLVSLGRDARRHYLKEIGRQSTSLLGSLHLLGNLSSLQDEIADGLADLKETGDYMGFVRHVRGGLAESYYKFADSWSACITQAPQSNTPSSSNNTPASSSNASMKSVRGVVGSLTSFLLSPPRDTGQGRLQLSNSPANSPPDSPGKNLAPRRLIPTDSEDHDSSGSEENSFSCIQSVDGWELVPKDVHRKLKGQEFLNRLQVSMRGEVNKDEKFVSCLKLRHRNLEDKLNALVTSQHVYFMRVGSPSADHVVLTIKLFNLYKARHKDQDQEHYLELLMRISGGKRLSLPSPNPADSPLVRCGSVKIAHKATKVINETKKKSEETGSS